jgi:outer membrane protein OmpA-like peptidoglycan-associated protein
VAILALALSSILLNPIAAYAAPNGSCNTGTFEGNGSEGAPYLVADATDFSEVADCGAMGYTYSQTADITLSGTWENGTTFIGEYYGNNHTIDGIHIDGSNGLNSRGLFPSLTDAFFTSLTIKGDIDNVISNSGLLAGIATHSSINLVNVYTDIEVDPFRNSGVYSVGGLVGSATSGSDMGGITVSTLAEGDAIEANGIVGGVVGDTQDSNVYNSNSEIDVSTSRAFASISPYEGYAGGIVGMATLSGDPTYLNLGYSTLQVTADITCHEGSQVCGGVAGYSELVIHDSFSNGTVGGDLTVGGLVGWTKNQVYSSGSTSNVSGYANVGGLIGYTASYSTAGVKVVDCYATGNVTATFGFVGGLIGLWQPLQYNSTEIDRVFATGDVTGTLSVGGLIGEILTSDATFAINESFALGDLTATDSTGGGAVGLIASGGEANISMTDFYFGGNFKTENFDGLFNQQSQDGVFTPTLYRTFWTLDSQNISSEWAEVTNAKQNTFFKRYSTFEGWNLEETWKLDRDFLDGYLSLRGVGTSAEVLNPTPQCTKVSLVPITFKKNSVKFTNATREAMRQNAHKFLTSYCSTIKIFGYASKDEPKKKQSKLALQRATAVANFVRGQLEQNWVYLNVIPVGKGVLKKGKPTKNRKATSTISN